jgi:ribonuclease HII
MSWEPEGEDLTREPLAALRRRVDGAGSDEALRRLARVLAGDPRAGAGALVRAAERRLAESRRLAGLFALRARLLAEGARAVAGVDEVGVGPLAGPVVACAVVLPERVDLPGLNDSKQLSPARRERLCAAIRTQAVAVSVGEVAPADVDRLNVYRAALEAMRRAVVGLAVAPDHLLVDARRVPGVTVPQTPLVHGDAVDGSIAAASIVAKVHRDAGMAELEDRYPGYGFARHKGYGTAEHLAALCRLGPSPAHRRSFAPVSRQGRV